MSLMSTAAVQPLGKLHELHSEAGHVFVFMDFLIQETAPPRS
jgi:hypothetical protein